MVDRATKKLSIIIETIIEGEGRLQDLTKNYQAMGGVFAEASKSIVKNALKQKESIDILARKNKFLQEQSKKLGINGNRVTQAMSSAGLAFDNMGRVVDSAGGKIGNLDVRMKKGELQTRKFQASLLSVMFAGMALQKSMSRLLRPAAEATGIFDIFGDILDSTFTPIMEALEPILSVIADAMDNMGEGTKIFIGAMVLLLFVAGTALLIFGQLGLAYDGLSVRLGLMTVASAGATKGMFSLGAASVSSGTAAQIAFAPFLPILWAIVAAAAVGVAIFFNWDTIIDGIKETFKDFTKTTRIGITSIVLFFGWIGDKISMFGEIVSGVFAFIGDFITGVWEGLMNFLSETWDSIKNKFKTVWEGIKKFFIKLWTKVSSVFIGIITGIWNTFSSVWSTLSSWFKTILGVIWNSFKTIWNNLSTWFKSIIAGIWNIFKKIWTFLSTWFMKIVTGIWRFFKGIWDGLSTWFSEKLEGIKTMFTNIWNGIKSVTSSVWNGIKGIIKGAINGIISFINLLIRAWNSLNFKVPKIKVGGRSFGGFNVGLPNLAQIPKLADGGIITKPTIATIGERGPEAVVPLNKGFGKGDINFSPTFNVTVSDKSEFENMIKFNNTKMVEDLRRLIKE